MKIRNLALATAALSLAASPAIAEAAYDRASAPAEGKSKALGGGGIGTLIGIAAVAGIITAVVVAAGDGNDDNTPTSP